MLIIFDFDGTVADTWDWLAGELIACSPRFFLRHIDRIDLERLRRFGTAEVIARSEVTADDLPALIGYLLTRAENAAEAFHPFDGMPGLLRDIHGREDELALVSSNSDATIDKALGGELTALFVHRRCGIGTFDKAAAFGEILKSAHASGKAVAIGDETRDLDAAAEVGIASIVVDWGYASAELLRSHADSPIADSVGDLRRLIEEARFNSGCMRNRRRSPANLVNR